MASQSGSEGEDHHHQSSQHQESSSPPAPPTSENVPQPLPAAASSGNSDNGDGKEKEGKDAKTTTKVSRKRTKTGCLTCRKRRIKCGEERPTCNNCIKSKRVCEGYNQRVVFKDGMNAMVRPGVIPIGPDGRRFTHPYPIQPAPGPQSLPVLAPAPLNYTPHFTPLDETIAPHLRRYYAERELQQGTEGGRTIDVNVPLGPIPTTSPPQEFGFGYQASPPTEHQQSPPSATASSFTIGGHTNSGPSHTESGSVFGPPTPYSESPSQPRSLSIPSRSLSTPFSPPSHQSNNCPFNPPMPQEYITSRRPVEQPAQTFRENFKTEDGADSVQPGFQMNDDFFDNIEKYLEQSGEHDVDYDRESEDEGDDDDELAEDSEYRVGGQEDGLIAMEVPSTSAKSSVSIQRQQISAVLEPFSRHLDEHSRISFKSFLPEASALQAYQAPHSDPLMNPTTAKIFCHFVYVLGPSMSLFERIPPNPHIAFTPGFSAGLHGPQNIWSYTIPMLSLNHPPLLHAILALSALHISKLKNGPDHPSLLHYHIALRRLGKSIASDRHRSHVATLAATLMLAYYETMAAEHDKWSSHIHGAKLLIKDIDFDRIARRIETLDDSGEMEQQQQTPTGVSLLQQRRMRRHMIADDEVDDSFKQFLMGNKQRRQSVHKAKMKRDQLEGKYAKKEMETLRLQADLFWWYTKMDCYQSLLSGCPLVLDYIYWDQCPPRSRIGTMGTPYGSSDHYFLLLGRLCDFQVRDLERKKAIFRANGNQWIPPPEMGGPPRGWNRASLSAAPPPTPSHDPHHQYGMIPLPTQPPHLPTSFSSFPTSGPELYTPHPTPFPDLDTATHLALQEWTEISTAFSTFSSSLGPDYQPLSIEYMTPNPTPFGPALYYKTYSIASLQMLLCMSSIVLLRCHPDMPPEAMVAASIQAPATARYANDVARIVAGLVPTNSVSETINPALGASLIEASMPVFYAAVQYQGQEQRDWTIRKLREINRLTGWATATRILLGCQRAWEVAAERGRGPVYRRPEMEEEREMWEGYQEYYESLQKGEGGEGVAVVEGGGGEKGFLWKMGGRRTVDAAGILGDREGGEGVGVPF